MTRSGFASVIARHHVVELADIAAHHPHLLAKRRVIGGLRVDVHDDDFLAALCQQRDQPPADKAGAADDQRRHVRFSPFANGVADVLAKA